MNRLSHPLVKTALLGGIFLATFCFLYTLSFVLFDANPFGRFEYLYMPFYALGLFAAMFFYRIYHGNGFLAPWKALTIGLIMNLVAGIFYATLLYGLLRLQPELVEDYKVKVSELVSKTFEHAPEYFAERSISEAQFAKDISEVTAVTMAIDKLIKVPSIGLLMVALMAMFAKRREPEKDSRY
ncbi:MAG: DUF4199 domain-containing protein [Bernardetiaceae bacterium]|nr:DUF4199 domain-containing protein [Bernardetiaceae bacterium]